MEDLYSFLHINKLSHLSSTLMEQDITLEILVEANDQELSQIVPKIIDKIKLRSALDKLRVSSAVKESVEVSLPFRQNATVFLLDEQSVTSESHSQKAVNIPTAVADQELEFNDNEPITKTLPVADQDLEFNDNEPITKSQHIQPSEQIYLPAQSPEAAQVWSLPLNSSELEILNCSFDFKTLGTERGKSLRQVLSSISAGKVLLAKSETGEKLNSVDRALLVKIIVEAEISALDEHNQSIRKDVWQHWSKEVSDLFTGESPEVYYVPYHIVAGKVIQASGLLHNRLITHRRYLNSGDKKKRSKSTSSDSSDSGASSSKETCKRFRPLPDNFNESVALSATTTEFNIEWLKGSSSPKELLIEKWNATLNFRLKILTNTSIKEYFSMFPGVNLPDGYELLLNDFNALYPNAAKSFEEKFPVIKNKLLTLLAEKSDTVKPDQSVLDLLNLASVSEENANLAAFLSITTLLRQMHTISVPRKRVWRLSREEVRSSFIARVTTPADIDRYCADREALIVTRGIPEQPYIIAVGASWATISKYEIVIFKGLRYPQKDICQAVKTTFSIYWALDCAYSKDSAPCWMFVQRTMFDMVSKFDIEGVPLRELLSKVKGRPLIT